MYCVSCDQWILTQAEAAQKILQERVGEKEEDRRSSDLTTRVAPHPSPVVNSNQVENGQSEQSLPSDRIESSSVLEVSFYFQSDLCGQFCCMVFFSESVFMFYVEYGRMKIVS